jgi:hypothetical protein
MYVDTTLSVTSAQVLDCADRDKRSSPWLPHQQRCRLQAPFRVWEHPLTAADGGLDGDARAHLLRRNADSTELLCLQDDLDIELSHLWFD